MSKTPTRTYISTITNVREVALSGTADLAYWQERLRSVGLDAYAENGRASLLLTAIESKFRGIPFRELSISVLVSDDGLTASGAYLAHAFNSSRLLAFAERVFFRTPYHLAGLALEVRVPARMAVSANGYELFSARMGSQRSPARNEDNLFEGSIYLPGGRDVFYAHLSGAADVYLFDEADTLFFRPDSAGDIFAQLVDSGFTGGEWRLRAGAVHARSKTFKRDKGRA